MMSDDSVLHCFFDRVFFALSGHRSLDGHYQ